ncbi:MAG: hypothetical protein JWP32_958 [Schumannella sp.]|nr:hypothetical protein [Schumannella sp.]
MSVIQRIVPWIVGAVVLTITLASVYVTAQQLDRQGADEQPQRLASQIVLLHDLPEPEAADLVDLGGSEALFYVVYDTSGSPLSGRGYLDGDLAQLPDGVIAAAVANGSNRVTWEPRDGLRFATVEVAVGDRVVMAGQSLAPSETRTQNIGWMLLLAWVVGLAVLAAGAVLQVRFGGGPIRQRSR